MIEIFSLKISRLIINPTRQKTKGPIDQQGTTAARYNTYKTVLVLYRKES